MSKNIRFNDSKLVDILRNELKEFTTDSLKEEHLQNVLYSLIVHIRNDTRVSNNIIKVNSSSYWNQVEENFYNDDKPLKFTIKERRMLSLLFKNINKSVSYDIIAIELWGNIVDGNRERIKTIVKQLRKKLPKNIIKNIFAHGYKLEIMS